MRTRGQHLAGGNTKGRFAEPAAVIAAPHRAPGLDRSIPVRSHRRRGPGIMEPSARKIGGGTRSHAWPMHGVRRVGMTDVTKGFRDGRFVSVDERDRRDLLKLMARVAEQAYRRGAQQGAGLAHRPSFRADLGAWRYAPALDLSPWIDSPRVTTSLERLEAESGEDLRRLGFSYNDPASGSGRFVRLRRVVWAGYTRQQRSALVRPPR